MLTEFTLPDLGEGITEAQVVRLLVKEGDTINEDQYLMEVETDKAAVEIPSPVSGVAKSIHVEEGQVVNVGAVIVTFDNGDGSVAVPSKSSAASVAETPAPVKEAPVAAAPGPATATPDVPPARATKVPAAPAVRKHARELGVDLDSVTGTGPGGRITKEDVERQAQRGAGAAVHSRAAPRRSVPPPAVPAPSGIADADKWGPIRREPLNQIRKTIATRMSRSAFTIPHVTHADEADITELDRMRRNLNEGAGGEPRLTVMSFVIRATCSALRKYPIFNASFDEDGGQIIYKEYINMGIAVDTERGLIVPVIRNADTLGLRAIAAELRSIADRIRASQFSVEDLRGGSFTITNVGALGGVFSTPLINYPEVAILALGRSRQAPVVRNGEVKAGLILPLQVSFDHRATDGANAARLTSEIVTYLETPAKFLLD
jgi:pyruvate/2-oxoglutarate dehydrogenase complex dihydrolipoamide acyltransferase (E2) component